jgi:poly(3-hydroxybutyrate) depolymerase
MLYQAYQTQADMMAPLRELARMVGRMMAMPRLGIEDLPANRKLAAACELFSLSRLTHRRPAFGIDSVQCGDRLCPVEEQTVFSTPFATLIRFAKPEADPQPPVLLVAPMSGHFATLLRETARTLLTDHDVYITDWHNAREVPLGAGRFGLDEYIEHVMQFLKEIGPGAHLMAVCQPCVATLAACALLAEDDSPVQPLTMTLMAGPVDCRVNPTKVNELATSRPIEWFESNLVDSVPIGFPGAMRRVYPGFMQLTAFISMNPERHRQAFADLYGNIVNHDVAKTQAIQAFYEEYFAVADLPAEFYLETVERVFQTYDLPRGQLRWRDRIVDPAAIRRTRLLTVEGERDDICAIGQTLAAQDLCSSLTPTRRLHHVQTGVGHYGVFSGKRWNLGIYPIVRDMIHMAA